MNQGAEHLAEELTRAGIRHAFGFPGEATLPWYAAMRRSTIQHVMTRCERCAGYMADAYARLTRRIAVCDSPGGIGSPHVAPALHEAYNSAVPMLMLTTATPDAEAGRWATSECHNDLMFASMVKEVLQAHTSARLGELARHAVNIAVSGRPGPVLLDVAADLLGEPIPPYSDRAALAEATFPRFRPRPDVMAMEEAVRLLLAAERPMVVAGGGTLLSGAEPALARFLERFQVPVATTFNGKGAVPETHPLAAGVVGAKGNAAANRIAAEADILLWLGSKAGDKSTNYGRLPPSEARVIQVDIAAEEHGRTLAPSVSLCADVGAALDDLSAALENHDWSCPTTWAAHVQALAGAFRDEVRRVTELSEHFGTAPLIGEIQQRYADSAVIVADASRACGWVGAFYAPGYAGRSVLAPRGSGSIGYALPATLAAALIHPDRPIIGIAGDGGFAMACHELETAVRYGLRFTFIILNNNSLGLLNQVARVSLNEPQLLGDFVSTDWEAVARGFGCEGCTVTSMSELRAVLDTSSTAIRPVVINAVLPATEESPDFQMFVARHAAPASD